MQPSGVTDGTIFHFFHHKKGKCYYIIKKKLIKNTTT